MSIDEDQVTPERKVAAQNAVSSFALLCTDAKVKFAIAYHIHGEPEAKFLWGGQEDSLPSTVSSTSHSQP